MEKIETPKNLYCETPPTVLRNRKEKFRTAKDNPFWIMIATYVFGKMVKARFHSLMYKGIENLEKRDKTKATIFYVNHSNWWDGIIGYTMVKRVFKGRLRLMIEEMNRFPLFQYIGCFPINKKTAQDAMKSLKYAATTLDKGDVYFWLFAEGIIRPPRNKNKKFQTGIAYLIENAIKQYGGINIAPISVDYSFLRQDKPEVILEIGEVQTFYEFKQDRKEFCAQLSKSFEDFCTNQHNQISSGDFQGYRYLFKQKLSWWRDIERRLKNIGMKDDNKQ